MSTSPPPAPKRRADAERNRTKILDAARGAFTELGADTSMAEISRRAEVGMATLYRNFPSRRDLLEALYEGEVDAMCAASETVPGDTPGQRLDAWLRRFVEFFAAKHEIANELLAEAGTGVPIFDNSRSRVMAAGGTLLAAARASGEVREDLTLSQAIDLVIAISRIRGDADYREPILRAALDGLRPPR